MSLNGIPIDPNEYIGDSLQTINASFTALDDRTEALIPPPGGGLEIKTSPVVLGIGGSSTTTVSGSLIVTENTTLGDSSSDTTTINGTLNAKNDLNVEGNTTLGDSSSDTININGITKFNRQNNISEGGEIQLARASDNAPGWHIDVIGTGNQPDLRFFDGHTTTVRMQVEGSTGNVDIPTGSLKVGNLSTGATDSVITKNSSNVLETREINKAVWNTGVSFVTAAPPSGGGGEAIALGTIPNSVVEIGTGANSTVTLGAATTPVNVQGDLNVDGNTTLGDSSSDTTTIIGTLSVNGPGIIDASSSTPALRVTQRGSGHAILIEDQANPDASPFVITNDGRVGIGTLTPTTNRTLTISADIPSIVLRDNSSGTGSRGYIQMYDGTGTELGLMGFDSSTDNDLTFRNRGNGGIDIQTTTGNTTRVYVASSGNVGIGTKTPTQRLHVNGTTYTNTLSTPTAGTATTVHGRVSLKPNGGLQYDSNSHQLYLTPTGTLAQSETYLVVRPSDSSADDNSSVERTEISDPDLDNIDGHVVLTPYFKTLQGASLYKNLYITGPCTIYIDEDTFEDDISVPGGTSRFWVDTFEYTTGKFAKFLTPRTTNTGLLAGLVTEGTNRSLNQAFYLTRIRGRFKHTSTYTNALATSGPSRYSVNRKFNQRPPRVTYRVYARNASSDFNRPASYSEWRTAALNAGMTPEPIDVKINYSLNLQYTTFTDMADLEIRNVCFDYDSNLSIGYAFQMYGDTRVNLDATTTTFNGPTEWARAIALQPNCVCTFAGSSLKSPYWIAPYTSSTPSSGSQNIYPGYSFCINTNAPASTPTRINRFFSGDNNSHFWAPGGTSITNGIVSDGKVYGRGCWHRASIILKGFWLVDEEIGSGGAGCVYEFNGNPVFYAYGSTSQTHLTADSSSPRFFDFENFASLKMENNTRFWSISGDVTADFAPKIVPIAWGTNPSPSTDVNSLLRDINTGNSTFKFKGAADNKLLNVIVSTRDLSDNTESFTSQDPGVGNIYYSEQPYNALQELSGGTAGFYRFRKDSTGTPGIGTPWSLEVY